MWICEVWYIIKWTRFTIDYSRMRSQHSTKAYDIVRIAVGFSTRSTSNLRFSQYSHSYFRIFSKNDLFVSELGPFDLYVTYLFLSADDESIDVFLHVSSSYERQEYTYKSVSVIILLLRNEKIRGVSVRNALQQPFQHNKMHVIYLPPKFHICISS
jgi:hypothetical protein